MGVFTVHIFSFHVWPFTRGKISFSGSLGYFKLGALLEGLRGLMSYKLALHVLVTFTVQVVPIHKHIAVLYSELPRYQEQKQSQ